MCSQAPLRVFRPAILPTWTQSSAAYCAWIQGSGLAPRRLWSFLKSLPAASRSRTRWRARLARCVPPRLTPPLSQRLHNCLGH